MGQDLRDSVTRGPTDPIAPSKRPDYSSSSSALASPRASAPRVRPTRCRRADPSALDEDMADVVSIISSATSATSACTSHQTRSRLAVSPTVVLFRAAMGGEARTTSRSDTTPSTTSPCPQPGHRHRRQPRPPTVTDQATASTRNTGSDASVEIDNGPTIILSWPQPGPRPRPDGRATRPCASGRPAVVIAMTTPSCLHTPSFASGTTAANGYGAAR